MSGGFGLGPFHPSASAERPSARPANPLGSDIDTWFKDASSATAMDGTVMDASWLNHLVGNLRYLFRQSGITREDDQGDDTYLFSAVAAVARNNGGGGSEPLHSVEVLNALSGTLTIDYSASRDWRVRLTGAVTSIVVTNLPPDGARGEITLEVVNPSGYAMGGWPAGTIWPDGGASPTLGMGRHLLRLITTTGGTTMYGVIDGINFQ